MVLQGKDTGASPSSFNEFDFVVIGGGLAGLVLATRLSENPNVSVGVLEIGPWLTDDPKINTPSRMLESFANPEYQAVTNTVPQKDVGGRQLFCPRGRVLGGGSAVNFMIWHRGSKSDYDSFEALGNPGWNFESLAKAGRKSETYHAPDTDDRRLLAYTDPAFHGTDGPIQTSFSGWIHGTKKALFEVLEKKKFHLAKNPNWHNGDNSGLRSSLSSVDPKNGTRSSTATGYYAPNASRKNLSVLCGARATKVHLEQKGNAQVATGVHYVANGQTYFVKARKEVIVSAGTLDSPQLLELSGIGNPSILKPLGIDVKVDNPNVGENLQDHLMTWMNYMTVPGNPTMDGLSDADSEFAKAAAVAYNTPSKTQAHGPLGGAFDTLLYLPVKTFIPEPELKEMKRKLHEETASTTDEGIKYQLAHLDDPNRGTMEWVYMPRYMPGATPPEPGRSYIALMASIQHPFSRGSTHITSADPLAHPEVDPHYMESSWDKSIISHALEQIDVASKIEPLASMLERRIDPAPGDDSHGVFRKYAEDTVLAGVHWVGSVSMLPKEKKGVVDPRCKVYGTANLRVVDASIIPLEISAHIQATIYAVAERAAELIIEDHN